MRTVLWLAVNIASYNKFTLQVFWHGEAIIALLLFDIKQWADYLEI